MITTLDRFSPDNKVHDAQRLKELQTLPLDRKIQISIARIIEWYDYWNGNVYVSFSGGKDSTVLLHLVRSLFPDVPAVFCNTGLEYPEIQQFVKSFENVEIIYPQKNFKEVITEFGYPLISKEVAEAAYYARRILPSDTHTHTHTPRTERPGEEEWNSWGRGRETIHKRWDFCGLRPRERERVQVRRVIEKRMRVRGVIGDDDASSG